MKDSEADAVIVGSGAGGGTAAHALTARGKRVIVLEKGGHRHADEFIPFDELHFAEHQALVPGKHDDANIYVPKGGPPRRALRWWIANMVGGATMLWEANLPRYTQEDFNVTDHVDLQSIPDPSSVSVVDWPWTYQEFEPYFEVAEKYWGVSGRARQAATQEPIRAGYDYPMPPLRMHASFPFLKTAFAKGGMEPYLAAKAINSRTYLGRPACPFCGFCQLYGCAVNDRASSTNTVLSQALASGLCDLRTDHYVTRVDHEKGKTNGVWYKTSKDGKDRFLPSDLVIVSVQSIQSARLFLLSGIPDPNDMIGHYLTYHVKGTAHMTFPKQPVWDEGSNRQYQPRTALGNLQMRNLYTIQDEQTYLTKGGKFSIGDPYTTLQPIRLVNGLRNESGNQLWGAALQDRLDELRTQGGVSLSFTGEAMSLHSNRVELDPEVKDPWGVPSARVHYRHHAYDVELSRYAVDRVCSVLEMSSGERRETSLQGFDNEGYGHNHGTLRAGLDPHRSVLDENCQSHTVKGLYVLDAAFMPTAGASNPTLTVIANAYRVVDRMLGKATPVNGRLTI